MVQQSNAWSDEQKEKEKYLPPRFYVVNLSPDDVITASDSGAGDPFEGDF